MSNITQEIARIRAALAAGPTPGPWNLEPLSAPKSQPMISANCGAKSPLVCVVEYARGGPIVHETALKNADYITACNPAAMTALLAHIDAQAAEVDRLGRLIKAVQNTDAAAQQAAEIERLRADAARYTYVIDAALKEQP